LLKRCVGKAALANCISYPKHLTKLGARIVKIDSKVGAKANLKKYIKLDGRWRFVPVAKHNGRPTPATWQVIAAAIRAIKHAASCH
jgi:hypothetical protein